MNKNHFLHSFINILFMKTGCQEGGDQADDDDDEVK